MRGKRIMMNKVYKTTKPETLWVEIASMIFTLLCLYLIFLMAKGIFMWLFGL